MRAHDTRTFATFDGVELSYRHWPAQDAPAGRAVVLLHRGHEHSGRVAHLVHELNLPDCAFFAWDARGHGASPGARGDAPGFDALVRDLDRFIAHIADAHGIAVERIAVVAQSVGAVIATTWVHDYAPRLRALVVASPAFDVKLYVPFARAGLALMQMLRGNVFVTSYVKSKWLTHDPERMASFDSDPLITRAISVRVLLGLYEAAERVVGDAQAITVPTLLLVSGRDFVVRRKPQDLFFGRLGATYKQRRLLPGFFHDTLGERDRGAAVGCVRGFINECFERPLQIPSRLQAHEHGASFDESQTLAWPHPRVSFAGLRWALTRAGLRVGGLLSSGIRTGLVTGFDSGSSLDYVYRDTATATGGGLLGRMVDRNYLDAIGWRGIRVRRTHLHELLRDAATRLRAAGQPVHVLDIAAGHGRYVLEALAEGDVRADRIALRDFSGVNVEKGRDLIAQRGMGHLARFDQGDAFDTAALAAIDPPPTLAIVSGLYELFPDNAQVWASLEGLRAAVPVGGYLVYTNQPWHPQLEFIARALTSHRGGQAWVMRRRSQQEMDELVREAGFRKIEQRIDRWGIFTVSLAQRVDA